MSYSEKLRSNITHESIPYGYTLAVWGSAALLLSSFNFTPELVFLFVSGGVTGYGILAIIAFKGIIKEVSKNKQTKLIVASMIHVLASLGTVGINYLLITTSNLQTPSIFFIVGVNATFSYNIMLLAEAHISEDMLKLERIISGVKE